MVLKHRVKKLYYLFTPYSVTSIQATPGGPVNIVYLTHALNYWPIIYHNSCHRKLNNALRDLTTSVCRWPEQRLRPVKVDKPRKQERQSRLHRTTELQWRVKTRSRSGQARIRKPEENWSNSRPNEIELIKSFTDIHGGVICKSDPHTKEVFICVCLFVCFKLQSNVVDRWDFGQRRDDSILILTLEYGAFVDILPFSQNMKHHLLISKKKELIKNKHVFIMMDSEVVQFSQDPDIYPDHMRPQSWNYHECS